MGWARLLDLIGKADVLRRFRLYISVARHGTPIYVHAKILIMDDGLMRVGSSKISNRSLGFDAECDLSVEAPPEATGADLRLSRASGRRSLPDIWRSRRR
jgi:phospholipase D1/2